MSLNFSWFRPALLTAACSMAACGKGGNTAAAGKTFTIALIAKYRPKRFDRLRNAIAGSLPAILATLALGSPVQVGYF